MLFKSELPPHLALLTAIPASRSVAGNGQLIFARSGCHRLILLKVSRADALITPEHCVLNLHKDREVRAAQLIPAPRDSSISGH